MIARAGVASRRAAEDLIRQGAVRVNGVVVRELGVKVDPGRDRVEVRGRRIARERKVYLLMNKPRRTVTSRKDPEGRKTVLDLLRGVEERVFPVGRLDYNTAGALLLTNDGELSQALSHPSSGVPRTYHVRISGRVALEALRRLMDGVDIGDDRLARATDVFVVGATERQTIIQMTIHEGRNHQIHRMLEAVGHRVSRLTRVEFAGLGVEGLRPGAWRRLSGREVGKLKRRYLKHHRARIRAKRS